MLLLAVALLAQNKAVYQKWIDQSFECLAKKDTLAAIDALKKALNAEPGNSQNALLLSNMGTLQRAIGQKQEALQSYTIGLFFAPRSASLLKNRASLFCEIDSFPSAFRDYDEAVRIKPEDTELLFNRGMLYLQRGDTARSLRDFKEILKVEPRSVNGRIGLAAWNKSVGAYAEADRLYTIIQTSRPKDPSVALARAELYYLWGKPSKALMAVDQVLAVDDSDAVAYFLKGKIKWQLLEVKEAEEAFRKAIQRGYPRHDVEQFLQKKIKIHDRSNAVSK